MKTKSSLDSDLKLGVAVVLSFILIVLMMRFGPSISKDVTSVFETVARQTEQHLIYHFSRQQQM